VYIEYLFVLELSR